MKKKYLLIVSMLTLCLAFAGCGKDKNEPVQEVQVTVTPTPEPTATPTPEPEEPLVQMQKTEKEKNAIGKKTATAAKTVIVNKTGSDVASIYIRPNTSYMDDSDWGTELVNGSFVLKTGEQAIYYFDAAAKDNNGNVITLYDIRINYANSDREFYFRKIPLSMIKEISLCMENDYSYGTIPYARYQKDGSTVEYSTLEEVKERLGYYEIEEEVYVEETVQEPTQEEVEQQIDQAIGSAESCIGSSLDVLFGTVGEPTGSDYVMEPESGETGYHYYDSFTVYTTVDENGNEIVAGVW